MKGKRNRSWRVVIDTNIWISFLIGKHLAGLHRYILRWNTHLGSSAYEPA